MKHEIMTFAFAAIMFLLLTWRVRRGYTCGMMQEIVNILSGTISLICVALVYLIVRSAINHSTHILMVCVIALILLGICFKICRLIFAPLLAVGDISFISGINKLLGAVLGGVEVLCLTFLLYKALGYLGFSIFLKIM